MNRAQKLFWIFWAYMLAHVPLGFVNGLIPVFWVLGDIIAGFVCILVWTLWVIYDELGY